MASRTPEEIRKSIEEQRTELSRSLDQLRSDVGEVSDWRAHVQRNRRNAAIGAGAAGFLLAGGIGALTGLLRRR